MTPRKSQQGASAKAGGGSPKGGARSVPSSSRTRATSQKSKRAPKGAVVREFRPAKGASASGATASTRAAATPAPAPRASARKPASARASSTRTGGSADRAKRPARPTATKRPEPSAWRWWLLPVAVLAATAVFVAVYYPVAKVQYRETREKVRLEAELDAIKARNARLQAQVDRLKTPEGVEDYAREQLGMVKAGEEVGVVVDSDTPTRTAAVPALAPRIDSEEDVKPPVGPWTAFLDSVFGLE